MKKFAVAAVVVMAMAFAAPAFAAMNPFMDVPASHWAYDAVAQLAARGVISGYPDGTYKGAQPTTRYEMASALARALATVDMEKASKQDVEMLKRLVVEFKDELDALGVKVDGIDSRVAVLEKDLGGWSLSGQFRFDAEIGSDGAQRFYEDDGQIKGKNQFDVDRYRIYLRRRINETTSFTSRLGPEGRFGNGRAGVMWEQYYITTKLGYDITMHAGVKEINWEGDLGLYADNDAYIGDQHMSQFHFIKDWGKTNIELVIGRLDDNVGLNDDNKWNSRTEVTRAIADGIDPQRGGSPFEQYMIAALVNHQFNEQFRAGIMAYFQFSNGDEEDYKYTNEAGNPVVDDYDTKTTTLGFYLGYRFIPTVELKGVYYHQKLGEDLSYRVYDAATDRFLKDEDTAKMWRIILDVDQEALKFTSLWLEYGNIDNHFNRNWGYGNRPKPSAEFGADIFEGMPFNDQTTKYFAVIARQQWNERWGSALRYYHANYDTDDIDNANQYSIAINYRLNPAVLFELGYDKIDYGDHHVRPGADGDENVVRFRTFVSF